MKFQEKYKKTINRNPFGEKVIHRYYLESLYFFENKIKKSSLIPNLDNTKLKYNNLALVVPEDTRETKDSGYIPDFTLYFKGYPKGVPVEIKWKSSLFNNINQVNYIKNNNGFLVVLNHDADVDVPVVQLSSEDFQDWMAKRIYKLTGDSLISKGVKTSSSYKWIVALRGDNARVNFKRMINATNRNNCFWAFKNSTYVQNQIFNLQKNDKMLFIFFKNLAKGHGMTKNQKNKKIEILSWYEVTIENPYYICLEGEQAEFFEKIRKTNNELISIENRRWVHFIDFKINDFKEDSNLIRKRGQLDNYLVDSSNYGGALTSVQQNIYDDVVSFVKTQSYRSS